MTEEFLSRMKDNIQNKNVVFPKALNSEHLITAKWSRTVTEKVEHFRTIDIIIELVIDSQDSDSNMLSVKLVTREQNAEDKKFQTSLSFYERNNGIGEKELVDIFNEIIDLLKASAEKRSFECLEMYVEELAELYCWADVTVSESTNEEYTRYLKTLVEVASGDLDDEYAEAAMYYLEKQDY